MTMTMTKIKVVGDINVVGRRWFQKSYGNTYHSVTVYVNDEKLVEPFTYGYDDGYKQTAHDLLMRAGYDVPEGYFDFIRSDNVTFSVYDVDRKRDL